MGFRVVTSLVEEQITSGRLDLLIRPLISLSVRQNIYTKINSNDLKVLHYPHRIQHTAHDTSSFSKTRYNIIYFSLLL
jgi:hypothetical protein